METDVLDIFNLYKQVHYRRKSVIRLVRTWAGFSTDLLNEKFKIARGKKTPNKQKRVIENGLTKKKKRKKKTTKNTPTPQISLKRLYIRVRWPFQTIR